MIDKIAYELVNYLASNVAFIDRWAGLVKPMRKKVQNVDKVFPVAINTPSNCDQSDYTALVPDSAKKSVVYVEQIGDLQIDAVSRRIKNVSAQLRLVVWYNLDLITSGDYISADVLADQIMDWLPRRLPDSSFIGIKQVHFLQTGVVYGSDIVSAYTYNEIKTQFNTHPYGLFAVDLDVWYVAVACQAPLDPDGNCITGKGNHKTSTLYPYPVIDPNYPPIPEPPVPVVVNFIDLDDTPTDYIGKAGKAVVVKQAEDGLEFADIDGGMFQP